jgi:hypothetical protein
VLTGAGGFLATGSDRVVDLWCGRSLSRSQSEICSIDFNSSGEALGRSDSEGDSERRVHVGKEDEDDRGYS